MFTKRQVLRMEAVLSGFRSSVVSTTFENRIFQGPTAFSASDTKGNYRKYMFVSGQKGTKPNLVVLETAIATRATAGGEKDAEELLHRKQVALLEKLRTGRRIISSRGFRPDRRILATNGASLPR
jgi:hypothetical protein